MKILKESQVGNTFGGVPPPSDQDPRDIFPSEQVFFSPGWKKLFHVDTMKFGFIMFSLFAMESFMMYGWKGKVAQSLTRFHTLNTPRAW